MKLEDLKKSLPRRSRGQVMVMFALFLTVLISFIALSIDVGYLLAERRSVQNAADAAAMAGGRLILLEETGEIDTQARGYVDLNGHDGSQATVTYPSNTSVAVEVTEDVTPFFVAAFLDSPWRVSARAVAEVIHDIKEVGLLALGENSGSCTGNPGNSTGIHFAGSAVINIAASVLSNGCVVFNGNATEGTIDGSVEAHSEVQDIPNDLQVDEEGILANQPVIDDPFANLAPPNCESMELRDQNNPAYVHPEDDQHLILEPGRYDGTIQKRRLSLKSGVYCFTGRVQIQPDGFIKSFDDDNGDGIPQPDEYHEAKGEDAPGGVLLYFDENAEFAMHGTSHIQVKTLGEPWEEIVLWFTNCSKELKLTGNNDMWLIGVIYAPCSTVDLTGNSDTEVPVGAIVANQIKIGGTPALNFNSSITIEIEPPRAYLVE
jgi:hypothetical protein